MAKTSFCFYLIRYLTFQTKITDNLCLLNNALDLSTSRKIILHYIHISDKSKKNKTCERKHPAPSLFVFQLGDSTVFYLHRNAEQDQTIVTLAISFSTCTITALQVPVTQVKVIIKLSCSQVPNSTDFF